MTAILLDLSGKLPPEVEAVLQEVARIAAAEEVSLFIVGALARDLLLEHAWNIPPQRATKDIDFGVQVESWAQFEALKTALIATTQYSQHPHQQQRLLHQNGVIVDVVPFGAIESPTGSITWPHQEGITMTTLGFSEAYQHTVRVLIAGDTELAVCSQAGLALLKLIAWNERRERKDAGDLGVLLYYYLEAGHEDRLYEEHADLLDIPDYKLAGASILGRDISLLLTAQSRPVVEAILQRETAPESRFHLASAMLSTCHFYADDFDRVLAMLEALQAGIQDVRA